MSLRKNIFFNIFYQIVNILIPIITIPYIARIIGKEGVGIYSYSTSIASYFALFILLGVGNYGSRSIARVRDNKKECSKIFLEIYYFQLLFSIIVLIIYLIFLKYFDFKYKEALFFQIFYLLSVVLDINWYFVGTEQFKLTVTRGIVIKIIEVFLIIFFVKRSSDVNKYILIMSIGSMIGQLSLFPILFKQIYIQKCNLKKIFQHIKGNIILFIPILATSVFTIMDKIMLGLISKNIDQVGIYEYSEKIVKLPMGIVSAIGVVMLSKMSNLVITNAKENFEMYFKYSMRYIGILVNALAFGIAGIAPLFSIIFYGKSFSECGIIITILAIILITSSYSNIIRTQYLIPKNKEKIYILAVILGATINLVFNYIFIPVYGALGAAIGTIGAEMMLFLVHLIGVWKQLNMKQYIREWIKYNLIGFLMFILVRSLMLLLKKNILTLCIQIIIGACFYITIVCILLLKDKDEIFLKYFYKMKNFNIKKRR